MGQIFRTSPLFPTVTKRLPPPFIWLGQYLNTTTTNYPIKGWCVYHFGLVNTWRNGNICTIGFLPHHDEIGESCSFVCFVQYQFMVGYFRYLVERRLVVSQINQSFLLSPTTSSENNVQPSRQKMDQNVSLPKLSLLHFSTKQLIWFEKRFVGKTMYHALNNIKNALFRQIYKKSENI